MLILALDTTSEKGGAAVYRDHQCLALAPNEGRANQYSVTLFQLTERALAEAGVNLGEVELFAVANGPGSFTGIRVGVAATQGWAKAFNRPVRGVSVLEALVEEARPTTDWAVPILDARRGEFFLGVFRRPGETGIEIGPSLVAQDDGWVLNRLALAAFLRERLAGEASVTCLAREHDHEVGSLREALPQSFRWQLVAGPLLGAIARRAWDAARVGQLQSPEQLDAYYIRRPDAELNWRE